MIKKIFTLFVCIVIAILVTVIAEDRKAISNQSEKIEESQQSRLELELELHNKDQELESLIKAINGLSHDVDVLREKLDEVSITSEKIK